MIIFTSFITNRISKITFFPNFTPSLIFLLFLKMSQSKADVGAKMQKPKSVLSFMPKIKAPRDDFQE